MLITTHTGAAVALVLGLAARPAAAEGDAPPRRTAAALTPDVLALLQPGGGLKGPPESLLNLMEADGTIRHPPDKVQMPDGTTASLPQHLIRPDGSLVGPPVELLRHASELYRGMEKDKDTLDRAKAFSPEAVQVLVNIADRYGAFTSSPGESGEGDPPPVRRKSLAELQAKAAAA